MIPKTANTDLNIFTEKVMTGVNKAVRQLVETSAANNKNLIVGDKDGNPISVPAKELLKRFSK